jgi:hypothetical protein
MIKDINVYLKHIIESIEIIEKTTKTIINSSALNDDTKKRLIPREKSSRCPVMYGLPKIHKQGVPLRPIVSSIGSPLQELARFLAGLYHHKVEKRESFVKDSTYFVEKIINIHLDSNDILVSFDVESLFTNIPIDETCNIFNNEYEPADYILELFKHCTKNTFFSFKGDIYKQIKGAPMGSPLSPLLAEIFMIWFERKAINSSPEKPKLWLRYVDDTFVIWPHGNESLSSFLNHLNNVHPNIHFTMEVETNNSLPFLDVLVMKKEDGTLGHKVFRKTTQTNRYLNANSHHHPSQINSVANTLITRSKRITDSENLNEELHNIKTTLLANGYNIHTINKHIRTSSSNITNDSTNNENTFKNIIKLPYIRGTTEKIGRLLKQQNIRPIFTPHRKISTYLRNFKNIEPLSSQGIYEIPCHNCEKVYIGKTNRKISARVAEHEVDVRNKKTTSTLAVHVMTEGHRINFSGTRSVASIQHETPRVYREAIEIERRPHSMNTRDDAKRLPQTWKNIIQQTTVTPLMPTTTPQSTPIIQEPLNVSKRVTRSQTKKAS